MRRFGLSFAMTLLLGGTAAAQSWVPWNQPSLLYERPKPKAAPTTPSRPAANAPSAQRPPQAARPQAPRVQSASASPPPQFEKPAPKQGPAFLDGGARPSISPSSTSSVSIQTGHGAGTIVIDTSARRLYLMQSSTTALAYPISVGRDGFRWTGTQTISRVASWPDWRPPAEMRQREPQLPEVMSGGLRNPLGAKALYLGSTLYRIHGTNSQSVGGASSSGCFRMTNGHVVDLANRVGPGTTVIVKSKL